MNPGRKQSGLAVVWIHYRTPGLLRESVDAVKADLPVSPRGAELVVVDNGGLDDAGPGVKVVRPRTNIGYAGGVNLGVARTRSPNILIMNPDVIVRPGCVPVLLEALQRHDVVAPSLFLDRERVFRLPPREQCDFLSTCIADLGRRHPWWAAYARRRWRGHANRHWPQGTVPVPSYDVSGAMLGFTRRTFDTLGPWDDGFPLYYEETDWLQRARQRGLKSALIPAAEAVHLYAQSTRHDPRAREWFAQSRGRFERKHFRSWQRAVLRSIGGRPIMAGGVPSPAGAVPDAPARAELSASACGYPAAAGWIHDPGMLERGLCCGLGEQLPGGSYWLRWIHRSGRELSVRQYRIGAG